MHIKSCLPGQLFNLALLPAAFDAAPAPAPALLVAAVVVAAVVAVVVVAAAAA